MTKIKYILFLLLSLQFFSQESINFLQKPFAELLAQAKVEKKLIFLDAYASWCGPCKLLEKNIFPQPEVREFYNKTFINTHIDMEKGEGPAIAQKYMIRSYPSLLFINGDGEIIQKALGYMDKEDFLALGKNVGDSKNATESPKSLFAKGEKDPQFLETVIKNNANSDYDFAKKAAERYFEVKTSKDLSRDEVSYILYFVKSTKDPLYKVFLSDKDQIVKEVTLDTYTQFNQQIKLSEVLEASVNQKDGTINEDYYFKNATPIVGKADAEHALNRVKVALYPQMGNFKGYEKAALEYYKNPDKFDSKELDQASWIFLQNVTDLASLNEAKMWSEKSVMKSENPENTYILAKLYQKTGDLEKARSFAQMSIDISKQSGKDSSLATALLNDIAIQENISDSKPKGSEVKPLASNLKVNHSGLRSKPLYVKVNALFLPIGILNVGFEQQLSTKFTLQADVLISPWKSFAGHELQYYSVSFEGRYYLNEAFKHFYLGLNVATATYNVQKWNYWNDKLYTDYRGTNVITSNLYQKGFSFLIGLTVGYQFNLSNRWNVDLYGTIGSSQDFYKGYDRTTGLRYDAASGLNRSGEIIPYRGGIMIAYKLK